MAASTTSNNTHTWIVVLLVWVIALVLFVAGYQVYRDRLSVVADLSPEELAAACADAVGDRLDTIGTQEDDADDVSSCPTTASYTFFRSITFDYPLGWHLSIRMTRETASLQGNNEPIALLEESEGPIFPLYMRAVPTSTLDTEQWLSEFDDATFYRDITKSSTALANGTQTTVKGHVAGLFESDFEAIAFEGATMFVTVTFYDIDDDATAINADWAIIKNSLDFSNVE